VFRAPRSERASAQTRSIEGLIGEIEELERGGVDLSAEDPLPIPEPPAASVTLKELREIVQDRFGAALDEPGRPVTWDPRRASRDPEGWAALATFGHPRLATILARSGHGSEGSALVFAGDGPIAAVRADRTPPEPVTSLSEIDTLGSPLTREEAETLARQLAFEASEARRQRHGHIERARHAQWEDEIRYEFRHLIRSVLASGSAAARYEGRSAEPIAIWHDLSHDTGGLQYAEAFMVRLGIGLKELIPTELGSQSVTPAAWAAEQRSRGQELLALMSTYRRHMDSTRSAS
jgi:hypothetical protein